MTGVLYRLGHICAKLRWLVLLIWIGIAAFMTVTVARIGSPTNDNLTLPGTGSQRAYDLLSDKFPPQQNGTSPIVFHIAEGDLEKEPYKQAITDSFRNINNTAHVYSAYNPESKTGKFLKLISSDHKTAYIPVLMNLSTASLTEPIARRVLDGAEPARRLGVDVQAGGVIGSTLSPAGGENADKIGILAAMLILALVFGSLIAMGLPIVSALVGLSVGLGTISLLGQVIEVPSVAPTLATMLGLGVGIDYALFMLTRHRDHVTAGMDLRESVARTTATSGGAIVFAGGTVVVAIASLAISGIPIVTALGYTSAIAVAVAIIAAVTLVPAVLAIAGHGIFRLQIPKFMRPKEKDPMQGWWARFAHDVAGHPVRSVFIALAILIPLIIPVFSLILGIPDTAQDPKSQTIRQAYDLVSRGFGPGYNGPFLVAVELNPEATPSSEYTRKKDTAKGIKSHLRQEKRSGLATKKRLRTKHRRLLDQGSRLQVKAAPFENEQARLDQRASVLQARKSDLEAKGTSLEARKAALQNRAAALDAKGAKLSAHLQNIIAQEEQVAERLQNTSDPQKIARLQARLAKLQRKQASTVRRLERVQRQGEHVKREGARLERQGARLQRQGMQLQLQADRLQRRGAELKRRSRPVTRKKNHLEKQGTRLTHKASRKTKQGKRENSRSKAQIARGKDLKHQLVHMLKQAGGDAKGTDPRLTALSDDLKASPGVKHVAPPDVNKAGDTAIYSVTPRWGPASLLTSALVKKLRATTIPRAEKSPGTQVFIGGQTASYIDLASKISATLPLIIAVVIALSFTLLLLAFRSVAIPAKAAVMNLLSVSASYGVLTAVFQWGWGTRFIGLAGAGSVPIASYVPLMMFAVLFGLSMDYEVFLMSQVQEHHAEGESDHDAVVSGLAISARVITSAAVIMVCVFGSFIFNSNPTVKQFGVGLAVAVAIDASVVRILLVPATMTLLGDVNWWLPKWLARGLPNVNIEGAGYFDDKGETPKVYAATSRHEAAEG